MNVSLGNTVNSAVKSKTTKNAWLKKPKNMPSISAVPFVSPYHILSAEVYNSFKGHFQSFVFYRQYPHAYMDLICQGWRHMIDAEGKYTNESLFQYALHVSHSSDMAI